MLTDRDLTPGHYVILMTLDQVVSASQQHLSRLAGIDPRNAVPVIDLLEQRALIERKPDPADRRRYAVSLTEAGYAALDELRRAGDTVERDMLKGLTAAERASLHHALARLFAELTREGGG
jgi:DNA-binding MarR family transcriptional regulator